MAELEEIKAPLYRKNPDTMVMMSVNEFMAVQYVHIREYRLNGDTGSYFPTGKGYGMQAEQIDTVIEALQEASEYIAQHNRNIPRVEVQLEFEFPEDGE